MMECRAEDGDPSVVQVRGELDMASADQFRRMVDEAIGHGPEALVFDLTELSFIDSSGLAVLLHAAANVADVRLRNPSTIVVRIIETMGLGSVLKAEA